MSLFARFERWRAGTSISLFGRLLAILLVALIVDFIANSYMFERARTFAVNTEGAGRMAEHLVVARRIVAANPRGDRARAAQQLSTERFTIDWHERGQGDIAGAPLPELRLQMITAEPELASSELQLRLIPIARGGGIAGSTLLPDGSQLIFRSSGLVPWSLNAGGLLRFALPSLVLFAIALWLLRRSFTPLQRLVQATRQVGTDEMVLLPEVGQSEVRELIRAFNGMHERIHQLLLNRTQVLLAVGHDLRTPLSRLQLRLDGSGLDEATRDEMADDITEMAELLASLQTFVESGQEHGAAEPIDLAAMVRSQVDDAADLGHDVVYAGPDTLEVRAHAPGLRRAIANLVQNALRYAGNAEVELRTAEKWIELVVADRGPGIPAEHLEAVLQPFIRLDTARARDTRGMGLGLAIVDRAIKAEGGQFELRNRSGGGLAAILRLPRGGGLPSGAVKRSHTAPEFRLEK